MLWLYILLGVLLFLFLLTLIPVGVDAFYSGDFRLRLKIGFVPITLYPPKPEKPKKKKKPKKEKKPSEKKKKKEKEKKPSLYDQLGLSGMIELIKRLASLAAGALRDFFRHLKIKKLDLSITVASSDAAATAVNYGRVCAAVYPSVSVIVRAARCKKYAVDVAPDFNEDAKTRIYLDFRVRVLILWLIALVFKNGFKALRLLIDIKKQSQ